MNRSSAWAIPYEIRPSKQVERRLVFETLLLAREVGVDVRDVPFIGMGGVRFIDMMLAHKVVSMTRFVSLEHDNTLWNRCELNKPFSQMSVYRGSAAEYLAEVGLKERAVAWFDIEKMASKDAKEDILTLATAVRPGSFVYVTAGAEMPRDMIAIKGKNKRLSELKSRFGPLADKISEEWMFPKDFHQASAHLALKFMRFAFNGRLDGVFRPLINLTYKDTAWMATVGGYFGPDPTASAVAERVKRRMKFLFGAKNDAPFVLEQFNITDAERMIFDRSATTSRRLSKHRNQLEALGFRGSVVDQYRDLIRFIPRYVEAAL